MRRAETYRFHYRERRGRLPRKLSADRRRKLSFEPHAQQLVASSVDVAPMSDLDSEHDQFGIANLAEHSIVAHAVAPFA
jgi:hypothetical protein